MVSRYRRIEVMGVFSSWVTALMKPSCCSLRRISRTRKMVFRIIPAMMAAKNITPKNSNTPSRQLRMVQPTVSAMARATREQPSTTKKAIVFLRLAICTVSNGDCTAKTRRGARRRAEIVHRKKDRRHGASGAAAKPVLQPLKPHGFCGVDVVAEATTCKD